MSLSIADLSRLMKEADAIVERGMLNPIMQPSKFGFSMFNVPSFSQCVIREEPLPFQVETLGEETRVKLEAILRRTQALLQRGWCRDAAARDELGRCVSPEAAEATAWCLTGAATRAAEELSLRYLFSNARQAFSLDPAIPVATCPEAWSDMQPSVEPVLALVERTIARVRLPK